MKKPKRNKKILYVDLDGVLANFHAEIQKHCPGLDLSFETDNLQERKDKVHDICVANPTIFHDLEPIEGAVEVVNRLFDIFDVYFLSTPMWCIPDSFAGKRIWVEKHFGDKAKNRLILSCRKDLCIGDYLVDDTTNNGAGDFKGEHIHFGSEKFPDWEAVEKYLVGKIYRFATDPYNPFPIEQLKERRRKLMEKQNPNVGENHLGRLIMKIREKLRYESKRKGKTAS